MYNLTAFSLQDMATCGTALRRLGEGAASMEEVADRMVRYLYDHLVDARGARAAALVRFFITRPYCQLDDELRAHIDRFLGHPPADPNLRCQTLLATVGDNPLWHSRHNSRFYKVHPLSKEIVNVTPMFAQVAEMFGIMLDQAVDPDPGLIIDQEQSTYNIFHVPNAVGNDYIPDQAEFVVPYGIQSLLGFYGLLPGGSLFTVILFARVPIEREATNYFRTLALNAKMAILPFDDSAVFAGDSPSSAAAGQQIARLRSQAAGLNQLLTVHEQVVQEQSHQIAQMVAESAVTEERRRLARDLHDSVTQALYSQTLYAEAAIRQLDGGNAARAAQHLRQLKDNAQQALREMRLLIFELRPPALEEEGLVAALRARLDAVEARTGLETVVTAPQLLLLTAETETGLYWIAQEALNNALKHAHASRIEIVLTQDAKKAMLTVADDGVGFDAAASPRPGALGLNSMQERAAKLGWRLRIVSSPGQGAVVQVEAPNE